MKSIEPYSIYKNIRLFWEKVGDNGINCYTIYSTNSPSQPGTELISEQLMPNESFEEGVERFYPIAQTMLDAVIEEKKRLQN